MVLVQIYVNAVNNNSYFPIPFSGTCSIRVLSMQYHSSVAATVVQVVQVQSDILLLPYSPMRYITMINNAQANVNIDQSHKEYNFKDLYGRGQILINVIDYATKTTPTGFTDFLLNLDVEELDSRSPQN